MAAMQSTAPTIEQPPIQPIPPDLLVAAQQQVQLLGNISKDLQGFSFVTGQGSVTAPGNPLELVSTVKTYLVVIRANIANTGSIYIGGRGVSAMTGYILDAGEAIAIQIDNLAKSIWIDAGVAGEGVSWMALVD
jgi:virulence-associated protein VapD